MSIFQKKDQFTELTLVRLVKKEGNSLVYTTLDGEIIKQFRKKWEANDSGCLDKVMAEYAQKSTTKISNVSSEEDVTE